MDLVFSCCSVCDARVSIFNRPTSLVSHLPSISLHSISLRTPKFHFPFVRNPPTFPNPLNLSYRGSCEAIPTNQSHLNPQIEEDKRFRHSALQDFLLQECRFSSSETALLISKYPWLFRRKSIDRAHQVLQMFKDSGFTAEQIKRIILISPNVLVRSADNYMSPAVEYLATLGMAEEDLEFVVSHNIRIFGCNVDKCLAPRILDQIKFFGSKDSLLRALRKSPGLASSNVERLIDKAKVLENAGLVEHEIKKVIEKDPRFLCSSMGKIEKNMKFLRCTLGLEPIVLVTYPVLLNYSVENRMMPRYKVLQYLKSRKGLIKKMIIGEKSFTERFLSGNLEAKMLYQKYKGKTVDVEEFELLTAHQR